MEEKVIKGKKNGFLVLIVTILILVAAFAAMMYCGVKLIDLIKVVVFHFWLKKERWLKNLTGREAVT